MQLIIDIEQPYNSVKFNLTLSVKHVVLLTQLFHKQFIIQSLTIFNLSRIQYSRIQLYVRCTYLQYQIHNTFKNALGAYYNKRLCSIEPEMYYYQKLKQVNPYILLRLQQKN